MLNSKTLEGFGGLLRKYCPKRNNVVFTELIKNLLITTDANKSLNKEKLVTLLTNTVGYSKLYKNEMADLCWQPLKDVDIDDLEKVVGKDELKKIEQDNRGKTVLHCYRTSYKLNRNGYGNYNPNMDYTFSFTGYRNRH